MGATLSDHEAYCVDEALALRLRQVEEDENTEPAGGATLPGGKFLPGPVL